MNTLVKLLNESGYKNTNTNRERAVKDLNLLLDSGVMSLTFINSEVYNSKENGRSFFVNCQGDKKRTTAYRITLFGKTYNGHIMVKKTIEKYCSAEYFDGTKEYNTIETYFDNSTICVQEMQLKVARLLSKIRGNEDFLKPLVFAKHGECSCGKCNGLGVIPAFSYYANGICFDCGGTGVDRNTLKSYIQESINQNV